MKTSAEISIGNRLRSAGGELRHHPKNRQHRETRRGGSAKVRTTAYTHTEAGGSHNAVGTRLSGKNVMSAAADWSRWPLGTKFRIVDTDEVFEIDDYGSALIGTGTIDLYKTEPARHEQVGRSLGRHRRYRMGFDREEPRSARAAQEKSSGPPDDPRPFQRAHARSPGRSSGLSFDSGDARRTFRG